MIPFKLVSLLTSLGTVLVISQQHYGRQSVFVPQYRLQSVPYNSLQPSQYGIQSSPYNTREQLENIFKQYTSKLQQTSYSRPQSNVHQQLSSTRHQYLPNRQWLEEQRYDQTPSFNSNKGYNGLNQQKNSQPRKNKVKTSQRKSSKPKNALLTQISDEFCHTFDGQSGVCRPLATCFYHFGSIESVQENRCKASVNGRLCYGVCCPLDSLPIDSDDTVPYNFNPPPWPSVKLPIEKFDVNMAVEQTEDAILRYLKMEVNFLRLGYQQRQNTMAALHQAVFGPPNQNLQSLNLNGFRALEVTRNLGRKFNLSPAEMRDGLSRFTLYGSSYEQFCLTKPHCNRQSKYRTIDGSCNNLDQPLWGKSNTQYTRVLPPSYDDGISDFRIAVNGNPLPAARFVSTHLTSTSSKLDSQLNVLFMQWGQFVTHDLTLGSSTRAATGQGLLCCNLTHLSDPVFHPACKPIIIPSDDPFYRTFRRRCNNFVRNAVGPKSDCSLGYREQTNTITSFIDASMVYGNEENRSSIVRLFRDGLLQVSNINGREWLPYDTTNSSLVCAIPRNMQIRNAQRRCLYSGDVRVNQQLGLTVLQLLLLREHNRIARTFKSLNPRWNDEILYQETRRIVGAIIQHITYNEWLPLALGRSAMYASRLNLQTTGHCSSYDSKINPSILNEFANGAFRWHTMVHSLYQLMTPEGRVRSSLRMNRIFNNPALMYSGQSLDQVTRGMLFQKCEQFDQIFVEDVKNLLFPTENASFGMDLISINIQRGRDHGLPSYNDMRAACGLKPVRNFRQLRSILQSGMAERFSQVYEHVDDIDFFVGGVNEITLHEGIVGPTFSCIVSEQFRRLKYGDRFWFENGGMAHSFTEKQLNEIRKTTLSGLVCVNGDNIRKMQPFAMLASSNLNSHVDCEQIPQMDLSHWQNERLF